ncbi:hypothetical protein X975_01246, partial [Stegodyphus mimosarum]
LTDYYLLLHILIPFSAYELARTHQNKTSEKYLFRYQLESSIFQKCCHLPLLSKEAVIRKEAPLPGRGKSLFLVKELL